MSDTLTPITREEHFLQAIADAYSQGGGESSDFTKATITINIPDEIPVPISIPSIPPEEYESFGLWIGYGANLGNGEYETVLYKGKATIECNCTSVTVSGNAEFTFDEVGILTVSGDCEITGIEY